jgi:tetratricopeptide (TPR) repeat protein
LKSPKTWTRSAFGAQSEKRTPATLSSSTGWGRGDYPEIEFLEGGFSITEQARIGSDTRSNYEQALNLLRSERYDEGIAMLRRVIESTPEATAPYIDIGIAYGMVGETALAEESLTTADLLSPANPVVLNELGILYRRMGRFDEARASYESALGIFEEFHFARRNLAVLCDLYLADVDCALRHYRTYLNSVGSDAEVEIWIADLENRLGNEGG